MPAIGAIILAAGSSSRMGQPKQLMRLDGQSLVRRAARAALDAGCSPVCVVLGSGAPEVADELASLGVMTITNPRWQRGMGTSLRAGLAELRRCTPAVDGVAIVLPDQVALTGALLRELIDGWQKSARPIAACIYAQTVGPPCCFASSAFDAIAAIADEQGAKSLILSAAPDSVWKMPWPDGAADVDTPADWTRLIQIHSAEKGSP